MVTLLDVYEQVCTEKRIPAARQKDVKTALKYLAASYGTTPHAIPITESLEATYQARLRAYFTEHPKGTSTIRNTIQAIGQFLKAFHQLTESPPVPVLAPTLAGFIVAQHDMSKRSPYHHHAWMITSRFRRDPDQWPGDMSQRWEAYRLAKIRRLEPITLRKQTEEMKAYVGYLCLTPQARLDKLSEHARAKLSTTRFQDDFREIISVPVLSGWDDLFQTTRLDSFLTWHSWRVHPATDAAIPEKRPSRPSRTGRDVAGTLEYLAKSTGRPEAPELYAFRRKLPVSKPLHDKKAAYHQFEFAELEQVALGLMAEARQMTLNPQHRYPGAKQAIHFQTGLILALAWRNPMRARNWCEAILGTNLTQRQGQWRWHFHGGELKIKQRGGDVNVFEPDVSPDVVPYLEEYLAHFRPHLPNSAHDRHVFPNQFGRPLTHGDLLTRLKVHTYRYTGKRLFTHLLRSLFMTHHLTNGVDINTIAYAMNDTPETVLANYNELMADKHRPLIHDANQRALTKGHGHGLTPPVIPLAPKVPQPKPADPRQMVLI